MIIVETYVTDVNLDLLLLVFLLLAVFFLYFKETLLDLSLNARLQLLLHVIQLKILAFEIFHRVISMIFWFLISRT